ncbi:MAG TPA: ankyrin repeat domain-containing protein [Stellaceae bacterium]|nr:ankyrin repeat domain-containing protein [Stellaceae bacterium]
MLFGLLAALVVALAAGPAAASGCAGKPAGVERLVCSEPSLAALAADLDEAFAESRDRIARTVEQENWLRGRRAACPAIASPKPDPLPGSAQREVALACLERLYRQRIAVLRYPLNRAAWPHVPFLPRLVAGAGTRLCEDLEQDLVAGFLGRGAEVDPLGEREIGFAPQPGLGDDEAPVLRADIDVYNSGKPVPVLAWIGERNGTKTVEYRVFSSPGELLAAIGRGGEPLSDSVRAAAHPLVDPAASASEHALFLRAPVVPAAQQPRFFAADGQVYVLAPAAGETGDLGVYRLSGPRQPGRLCLFAAQAPTGSPGPTPRREAARGPQIDAAFAAPVFAALTRAAGPLTPTGRFCRPSVEAAARLGSAAAWRPWALDRRRRGEDPLAGKLQIYMRNRALTGPEMARDYRAYSAARAAAIAALAPFYRDKFGRSPAEAERLAALYADRLVALGFEVDPDDDASLVLFDPGYADEQKAEKAALAGDSANLRAMLGEHPKEQAELLRGELDEPLVSDALFHPDTLDMLLGLGLDPNERGPSGHTPLMIAARLDLVAAARLLLAHGAVPDLGAGDAVAQTDRAGDPACLTGTGGDAPGRTALSYAAEFASPEFVRLLLDHGASPQRRDSAGRRPADYLKRRRGDNSGTAKIAAMLK